MIEKYEKTEAVEFYRPFSPLEDSDDIESEFASSTAGRSSVVHPYQSSVAESSMTPWDMDGISVTNSGASVNSYEEVMT
jgi:cellulose synthase A